MHVHFGGGPELVEENKALLPLYVANGITTIRDASGDLPDQVLAWRGEIANGKLFGPRLLTSGAKIEESRRCGKARSRLAARPTSTPRCYASRTATRSISSRSPTAR